MLVEFNSRIDDDGWIASRRSDLHKFYRRAVPRVDVSCVSGKGKEREEGIRMSYNGSNRSAQVHQIKSPTDPDRAANTEFSTGRW